MNDPEVARLRRLRNAALLVRKIARELSAMRCASSDPILVGVAHASWRIVRTVSGRLKGHPYVRYQKDASLGSLLAHSLIAQFLVLTTGSRAKALAACAGFLRQLMRQLDDARALTWATDLSDAFGRSQAELNALMNAIERETRDSLPVATPGTVGCDPRHCGCEPRHLDCEPRHAADGPRYRGGGSCRRPPRAGANVRGLAVPGILGRRFRRPYRGQVRARCFLTAGGPIVLVRGARPA